MQAYMASVCPRLRKQNEEVLGHWIPDPRAEAKRPGEPGGKTKSAQQILSSWTNRFPVSLPPSCGGSRGILCLLGQVLFISASSPQPTAEKFKGLCGKSISGTCIEPGEITACSSLPECSRGWFHLIKSFILQERSQVSGEPDY